MTLQELEKLIKDLEQRIKKIERFLFGKSE